MSTNGRTVTPGASIGQMKYEMPWCLGALGFGPGQQDAERGRCGRNEVQTFWPRTTQSLAVAARPGWPARPGRIRRRAR